MGIYLQFHSSNVKEITVIMNNGILSKFSRPLQRTGYLGIKVSVISNRASNRNIQRNSIVFVLYGIY